MEWTWSPTTATLTQDSGYGPEANGVIITLTYTALYPFLVHAETVDAATDPREAVLDAPDIFDPDAAQLYAEGLLDRRKQPYQIRVTTREGVLRAGYLLTINVANPPINDDFLLTRVSANIDGDGVIRYTAEGDQDTLSARAPSPLCRQWSQSGGGGGGGGVAFAASSSSASAGCAAASSGATSAARNTGHRITTAP